MRQSLRGNENMIRRGSIRNRPSALMVGKSYAQAVRYVGSSPTLAIKANPLMKYCGRHEQTISV